jgi:coenzyme F420-dependent glucose-6-phosphate dehydrogenase
MTAALERTTKVSIGPGVTVPGQRYHPAIIAQAFSTLEVMYPKRTFLGLGSGEPISEMPLGSDWGPVSQRLEKFEEGLKVIRLLFDGEFVDFAGKYFKLRSARLYTKPRKPPPIYVSAAGPKSARIAGRYADGVLIISGPEASSELLKGKILPAVREGARETGRDPETIKIGIHLLATYDEDEERVLHGAHREYWNHTVLPQLLEAPICDPRINQVRAKSVDEKTFAARWIVETSAEGLIRKLEPFVKLGIDELVILSASPDEEKFIRVFGMNVVPYLRETYRHQ